MDERPVSSGTPTVRLTPSLMPKGLREKLFVSFALMSIVPLLVLGYVVSIYVFPHVKNVGDLSLIVVLTLGVAFLGFAVIRSFVLPVVKLAADVQKIVAGELDRRVSIRSSDEVGEIGSCLNQITQRVRENMQQLQAYGEEAGHLNREINRRIMAFSNLLQVSNLITQTSNVDEVITFILEKLTQLEEAELNLFLEPTGEENILVVRAASGIDQKQSQTLCNAKIVAPWLQQILLEHRNVVVDEKTRFLREKQFLQERFGMTNAVCQLLTSLGKGVGILVSANRREGFTFSEDALELFKVFGKQMAIAIENDLLNKRAENLEIIDELTGLYNMRYMKIRLQEEIKRAMKYHRPCSIAAFDLDGFRVFQDGQGVSAAEMLLRQVAELFRGYVSEVDRVGRTGLDEFVVILPERNKREAIDLAEKIRQEVQKIKTAGNGPHPINVSLTISGGVSSNPLDGATSDELLDKAMRAIRLAKMQGKNRIIPS